MSIQRQPQQKTLPQRDRARQAFLKKDHPDTDGVPGPNFFTDKTTRDSFLIESLKACLASDLRRLTDLIGREAVGDWMAQDPDLASFIRREVLEKKV